MTLQSHLWMVTKAFFWQQQLSSARMRECENNPHPARRQGHSSPPPTTISIDTRRIKLGSWFAPAKLLRAGRTSPRHTNKMQRFPSSTMGTNHLSGNTSDHCSGLTGLGIPGHWNTDISNAMVHQGDARKTTYFVFCLGQRSLTNTPFQSLVNTHN